MPATHKPRTLRDVIALLERKFQVKYRQGPTWRGRYPMILRRPDGHEIAVDSGGLDETIDPINIRKIESGLNVHLLEEEFCSGV